MVKCRRVLRLQRCRRRTRSSGVINCSRDWLRLSRATTTVRTYIMRKTIKALFLRLCYCPGEAIYRIEGEETARHLQGHQYETVSGFICESFGYIPEEGQKTFVVLEKANPEDNDEYNESESDQLDEKERCQTFEIEILEASARKVGKVQFKPIKNGNTSMEAKALNRLVSTKVVKRKKQNDKEEPDTLFSSNNEITTIPEDGFSPQLSYKLRLEDDDDSSSSSSSADDKPGFHESRHDSQ